MNDHPQHEFDDELLSAYLDDELSAEERALVEARLAADPAAQHSLDQLRNVSQSMRGLPKQALPGDFREAVLRRIETTKEEPVTPKVTIGRTRRGWIWASLAVAAALLIMLVQSDDTDDGAVTDVALNGKSSAGKDEALVEAPAQWRAGGELARSEPEVFDGVKDLAAAPAAREPVTRDLSESVALSEPAPASASTRSLDRYSKESFADSNALVSESAEGRSSLAAAAPTAPPADAATEPQMEEDDVVVVHILAKQAAITNKTFDKLLADNGVVVDPTDDVKTSAGALDELQQAGEEGAVVSGRFRQPTEPVAEKAPAQQQAKEEVDVVLVEAPSSTIFSCMQDLNNDSSNYLSVLVDAPPTTDDEAKRETPAAKKLATDLGVYNRSAVRTRAQDALGDKADYFAFEADNEAAPADQKMARSASGTGVGGGNQARPQSLAFGSNLERGRARRLQPQAQNMPGRRDLALSASGGPQPAGGRGATTGVEFKAEVMKRRAMLSELEDSSGRGDAPLQVLFVLRSGEESPPSAPAADRAE